MRDMGPETVCGGGFCSVEETVPRRGLCPGGDCVQVGIVPRRGLCRENMDGRRCR